MQWPRLAFAVFIQGHGTVPFDQANNRVFVRFKDTGGITQEAPSVAAQAQGNVSSVSRVR